jgi:hypothetical protein
MNSPSDLSILRVYLPDDLLDDLHALCQHTGLPMRKVVRGIIELGIPTYVLRWQRNLAPVYDDELSERPHQLKDRYVRRGLVARLRLVHGAARRENGHDPPYDEPSAAG